MNEQQIKSLIKEEIAKELLSSVLEEQLMSKFLNFIKSKVAPSDQAGVEQAVDGALEELDGPILKQFLELIDKNVRDMLQDNLQGLIEYILEEAIQEAYREASMGMRGN